MAPTISSADVLIGAIEFDTIPWGSGDPSWLTRRCQTHCTETVENGVLKLLWPTQAEQVGYTKLVGELNLDDPTFWVEARFRSNQIRPLNSPGCDGRLSVTFFAIHEWINLSGDSVVSGDWGHVVSNLDPASFHIYRFETDDGVAFRFSVDGQVFWTGTESKDSSVYFSIGGSGGCNAESRPALDEWDYLRYGRLADTPSLVKVDPPPGFVDPNTEALRITLEFSGPMFLHRDEIGVETTGGQVPEIQVVTRGDGYDATTLDLLLDRPLRAGETTRLHLSNGETIRFTLAFGDTDGDGQCDLRDAAVWQSCFGTPATESCAALDVSGDGIVNNADTAWIAIHLKGPD